MLYTQTTLFMAIKGPNLYLMYYKSNILTDIYDTVFLFLPHRYFWYNNQTNEIDYYIRNNPLANRNLTFFYYPEIQDLTLQIINFVWPMRIEIMQVLIS